jgi:hypothetical protein
MPVQGNHNFNTRDSLHDFLHEYIAWNEKLIAEFHKSDGAVYRPYVYWKCYVDSDELVKENYTGSFTAFEKAWGKINDWTENYQGASEAGIQKEYLDNDHYIHAKVNANGEIINIGTNIYDEYPDCLSYLYINIPVPFEQGDLLEYDGKPCVLTYLPKDDMHANIHYLGEKEILFCYDHVPYYCLKLWHGELKGQNRFLRYLSLFLKKYSNVNIHDLTNIISGYCKFTAEAESTDIYWYDELK